ncbi:peptide transporter [Opitutaceae bacterium TAV5]|nr:peptide transporter [Opitutaceae bacterium TAV5]
MSQFMKPVLLVLLLTATAASHAQTYEQVAPQTPAPAEPAPPVLPVPQPEPESGDDRVLTPALLGLVFVTDPAGVRPEGVSIDGIHMPSGLLLDTPAFREKLETRLGKPLTLGGLREITREAVLAYRAADRPIVDVAAPEQNIRSGTIQLLVTEGRLGEVRAEGNRWFSSGRLTGEVRIAPGESISGSELLDDLAWLNQNPFRRVDLVFARGAQPGETDVILRTQDRRPWRVYAGYDDSGTPLTDEDRLFAGFNWGDVFGLDHQLNYQFTTSPDFEKMVAHSASYVVPLPWRHTLTLFGSYAKSEPDIPPFNLEGTSWQAGLRYRVPLRSWQGVEHAVSAGFDFKRSDNNLAFGGMSVFAQATDVVQLVLGYEASLADRLGVTSAAFTVALSPGGIGGHNDDADYAAARSYAEARYAWARLALERTTRLPQEFSWVVRAEAQLASGNLLGSEQLGFGGASSLRGYDEREANGDSGFILVNELHGPAFSVARHLGFTRASDRLVPLVFLDAGVAVIADTLPGEERTRELLSTGIGLRYTLAANIVARFDYGWQLRDSGVSPTGDNQRGHVSVTVAW